MDAPALEPTNRTSQVTEAEWEYAARGGTTTAFPWGPVASHEYANYGTEKCCGDGLAVGRDQWIERSPAGSSPPNGFGLYDMDGNVLQFVQDGVAPSYAGLATDGYVYEVDVELKATDEKLRDSLVGFCVEDVLDGASDAAKLQKCVAEMLADFKGTRSCSYRIARGGDWGDPPPHSVLLCLIETQLARVWDFELPETSIRTPSEKQM